MLTLTLPYPISANAYWASRIVTPRGVKPFVSVYVTTEARKYKEQVAWLAKAAGVRAPITGRVAINIRLYPARPQDWQTRQRKLGEAWDDSVQCLFVCRDQRVLGGGQTLRLSAARTHPVGLTARTKTVLQTCLDGRGTERPTRPDPLAVLTGRPRWHAAALTSSALHARMGAPGESHAPWRRTAPSVPDSESTPRL